MAVRVMPIIPSSVISGVESDDVIRLQRAMCLSDRSERGGARQRKFSAENYPGPTNMLPDGEPYSVSTNMHNLSLNITGTCVSPGKVSGTIRVYQKDVQYIKDDIVLLNEWVTTNVAYLKDAGGLISFRGGITCHASIIAREFKLPCLVAVQHGERLVEGARVTLDATNEIIDIV